MSPTVVLVISIVTPVVLSALVTGGLLLFKRSIFSKMDEMAEDVRDTKKDVQEMSHSFSEFKVKVAETYARKDELEPNGQAHKEMWIEINSLREKFAGLKTLVAALKELLDSIIKRPEKQSEG